MAAYRIVKLDDSWKGRTRQFRYRTDSYLDVQIVEERGVSRIEFRKKMFDAPVEKELEVSWMKDHMAAPMLFAAVDDEGRGPDAGAGNPELQHAGDWFLSVPGFCHRRAGPVPLFQ